MKRHGVTDVAALVVVHDELDLPPGTVRVKAGGGLAGNNGLRSITAHLHTQDYLRVRIGIGKPPSKERGADHVLSRMPLAERELLDVAVERAADAVEAIVTDGVDAAMRLTNGLELDRAGRLGAGQCALRVATRSAPPSSLPRPRRAADRGSPGRRVKVRLERHSSRRAARPHPTVAPDRGSPGHGRPRRRGSRHGLTRRLAAVGTLEHPMRLEDLPLLLRSESALTQAIGDPNGLVAVPEAGRAISVAALAQLSGRRPLIVATPTGTDAGQLYDDLCQYMPDGEVVLFPGMGDAAVRAGQPERGDDGPAPRGAVAPAHPRAHPGDRRRRRPRPAPAPRSGRDADRSGARHPRRGARSGRGAAPARRARLPPRAARRAPRRGGDAWRDPRRLPVHGGRARCASTCGATRSTG